MFVESPIYICRALICGGLLELGDNYKNKIAVLLF